MTAATVFAAGCGLGGRPSQTLPPLPTATPAFAPLPVGVFPPFDLSTAAQCRVYKNGALVFTLPALFLPPVLSALASMQVGPEITGAPEDEIWYYEFAGADYAWGFALCAGTITLPDYPDDIHDVYNAEAFIQAIDEARERMRVPEGQAGR